MPADKAAGRPGFALQSVTRFLRPGRHHYYGITCHRAPRRLAGGLLLGRPSSTADRRNAQTRHLHVAVRLDCCVEAVLLAEAVQIDAMAAGIGDAHGGEAFQGDDGAVHDVILGSNLCHHAMMVADVDAHEIDFFVLYVLDQSAAFRRFDIGDGNTFRIAEFNQIIHRLATDFSGSTQTSNLHLIILRPIEPA
ncbi:MAG: hypothetical protein R6X05_06365 [Desulfobacterales bacterium]